MILFGYNNYKVKTVLPTELGLMDESFRNSEIQLRQKYFHLYYIPLFPLGQYWTVMKNGEQYVIDPKLENIVKQLHPSGIDWKSFALVYIITIGMTIYFTNDKISNYKREKKYKADMIEKGNILSQQLKQIKPNNIIEFNSFPRVFLKVIKAESNRLLLTKISDDDNYSSGYSFPLSGELEAYMRAQDQVNTDSFWINRTDLNRYIRKDDSYQKPNNKDLTAFNADEIAKVITIDNGYFYIDTPTESTEEDYYEFANLGCDVRLDSLVASNKKEDWKLSKDHLIKHNERFAIKVSDGTIATIYYTTLFDNKQHLATFNYNDRYNQPFSNTYENF